LPVSFLGLLCKLQRWPGGDALLKTGEISLVLLTIFVLLVLPSTGFIDWLPLHKKILKRLLLSWALIFFLFLVRYLLPEANRLLWNSEKNVTLYGFEMKDYEPEIKNGL
jgi:cytochrome c biogenesis protein CcdA